ncbi:uncharacterized protein LACBIDRAFT_303931 [Laccaria bicolor S238N-H82]|uniref:Predicted protein n=1 Tax=Laccaria bicolor (strain S238N-H82 / ATCC MYA-4686) TaxID=486041 RepID=B0DJZ7_LACBS|nr:uncharacterized protein LACBIDRAFT_303931 [Laccaria bicolor S238N-H82]EDR05102.1 predicted protein [Laccaria bicolor S238N-H82]|eukprot:XP_001884492.1 predicted protein [Laccaria bicolor S238N-H82]
MGKRGKGTNRPTFPLHPSPPSPSSASPQSLIQPLPNPFPSHPRLFFYTFLFLIIRHLDTLQCMPLLQLDLREYR